MAYGMVIRTAKLSICPLLLKIYAISIMYSSKQTTMIISSRVVAEEMGVLTAFAASHRPRPCCLPYKQEVTTWKLQQPQSSMVLLLVGSTSTSTSSLSSRH
jgi:hypothetical protein